MKETNLREKEKATHERKLLFYELRIIINIFLWLSISFFTYLIIVLIYSIIKLS